MNYTTFAQFQASRVAEADLRKVGLEIEGDKPMPGFTYDKRYCYIETLENGEHYLMVYNEQWQSADLDQLEAILFTIFYAGEKFDGILNVDDESLNDYLRTYCKGFGIECDGDAFGLAFSGKDNFTVSETISLIQHTAKTWDLGENGDPKWRDVTPAMVSTLDNPSIDEVRAALAASEATILHVSPPCEAFAKPAASEELPVAQYKREFPDFDYVIPTIYGLKDASWGNDVCPCFEAEEFGLQVWFDYADRSLREFQDDDRKQFHLRRVEADGNLIDLVETDDFAEILKAFYSEVVKDMTSLDRRAWLGEAYRETVGYNPFEDSDDDETTESVLDMLAGVIAEDFHASNEVPQWPDTTEMIDAITAAEIALQAGQINVAGNDKTEGDEADEETIYFAPLVLCRKVLADVRRVKAHEATSP